MKKIKEYLDENPQMKKLFQIGGMILQWYLVAMYAFFAIGFLITGSSVSAVLLVLAILLVIPIKKWKQILKKIKINNVVAIILSLFLAFCSIVAISSDDTTKENENNVVIEEISTSQEETTIEETTVLETTTKETTTKTTTTKPKKSNQNKNVKLSNIPKFSGEPFVVINNNVPSFTSAEKTTKGYESYSKLDNLGRCGVAIASLGKETMPKKDEDRGSIGEVTPSGWVQKKYDFVDGKYLYNRCHLIGWQLSAENANERNLITGTKYLNIDGMLEFENMVADYIKETNNHVAYRITPVYEGNNLVASGVQMEAYSVEDKGEGISFNVYCYNVQPGVKIDYSTGNSAKSGEKIVNNNNKQSNKNSSKNNNKSSNSSSKCKYVLNTNSKKFHKPNCKSVAKISKANKKETNKSREELIKEHYEPCGNCKP